MAWGWLRSLSNLGGLFQCGETREIDLGAHSIKSHGAKVVKNHLPDWITLLLLAVVEIVLFQIHPFHRFVGEDMMTDLKYPLKDNTVPVWAVPIYAVLLPIAIFLLIYLKRRDVYDLHHGILGLLYAVLLTGVITDAIKVATGRPRPNFFWHCFPDGVAKYGGAWGDVTCHGKDSDVREGHNSFPSGHTSWSSAGLGFLSLYLSGKVKVFDGRGHVAKLCIVLFPLLAACLVGISRVSDYRHHWQDVFAGGILGLVMATLCYLQFFPPPFNAEGWGTYEYFRTREELQSNISYSRNSVNGRDVENNQYPNQRTESHNEVFMAVHVDSDPRTTLDEMELGKR